MSYCQNTKIQNVEYGSRGLCCRTLSRGCSPTHKSLQNVVHTSMVSLRATMGQLRFNAKWCWKNCPKFLHVSRVKWSILRKSKKLMSSGPGSVLPRVHVVSKFILHPQSHRCRCFTKRASQYLRMNRVDDTQITLNRTRIAYWSCTTLLTQNVQMCNWISTTDVETWLLQSRPRCSGRTMVLITNLPSFGWCHVLFKSITLMLI